MRNGSDSNSNNDNNNNNNRAITLKAAVVLCWPNEAPIDVVRLIKKGYIEVLVNRQIVDDVNVTNTTTERHVAASKSLINIESQTQNVSNQTTSSNTTTIWKIVRQYGKRMIHPNDQLRRKRIQVTIDNSTSSCSYNCNCSMNDYKNNNQQPNHVVYEIRSVPMYPIVIVMNKPCGYIVTKNKESNDGNDSSNNNNHHNHSNDDDDDDDADDDDDETSVNDIDHNEMTVNRNSSLTTGTSSSLSIYDLLYTSILQNINLHSLLPYLSQLRSVGRLDKNTEGLLLFTNHGRWNIALTTPFVTSTNNQNNNTNTNTNIIIWKRYRCYLQNPATELDLLYWRKGGIPFRHMKSNNGIAYSSPALYAEFVSNDYSSISSTIDTTTSTNCNDDTYNQSIPTSKSSTLDTFIKNCKPKTIVDVVIGEGKYRQVRRCWESLSNNKVIHLKRISFGPIELIQEQSLQVGQCRSLSIRELQTLEQYVNTWYSHNPNYN
jgi:16S rRNA U516 pseudouridylate synthase RsuA-like enzyme